MPLPFCQTEVKMLKKTTADSEQKFRQAPSNFVHLNFYVDDRLVSFPITNQAIDLVTAAQRMLATANLRLHKLWKHFQPKTEGKKYVTSTCTMAVCQLNGHSESTGHSKRIHSPFKLPFLTSHSHTEGCSQQ